MESGLAYRAGIEVESAPYDLTVALGETVRLCGRLFLILWILQLLMLVGSLSSNARAIRRTLRPIAELAETAESLNRAGRGALTPGEMETLAGKIDRISAAGLDTRIAVDGTQEELKNLAAAINGMLDRINESYRTQVRFVSDASHELRTPIAVIQGYANLLDRWGKHDEKVLQESIDAIKDEVNNMKTLVEQLLFLARGDNDTMTLKMERFELSTLAEEVLRETRMIDGGHRYESSLDPVFIVADTGLVKQALRILVDNAVKYTPAGGLIRISVSEKEGQAFLTVRDEGIGILPEAVPKIFDRFYRTDESRARATGGAGLGLSIARWIAQRHGGHMEVLSREGIGTRISVVLPAAPEIEAGGAADEKKTAEPEPPIDGEKTAKIEETSKRGCRIAAPFFRRKAAKRLTAPAFLL
jgi:signal transduction histidine kinase